MIANHGEALPSINSSAGSTSCMGLSLKAICSAASSVASGILQGEEVDDDALSIEMGLDSLLASVPYAAPSGGTKAANIVMTVPSDYLSADQTSVRVAH